MTFTMAYPNFKKGLKMAFGPLGVICYKWETYALPCFHETSTTVSMVISLTEALQNSEKCILMS
jgi:hypothetical protein